MTTEQENLILHKILNNIDAIVWKNLMFEDNVDVDQARIRLMEELGKWYSIRLKT